MCKMWVNLFHVMKQFSVIRVFWSELCELLLRNTVVLYPPLNINYCRHHSHNICYLHHWPDGGLHMCGHGLDSQK